MWSSSDSLTGAKLSISSTERLFVLGWLAILFLWTLTPLAGYDFWFYLAMGREIVTSGEIPVGQSFLGTTSDLGLGNYADTAWLGNFLCYAVYGAFGMLGLVMLKSALLTLSTGLVYLGNRLGGLSPFWAGAWATLALWTIRGRFEMRLYLFTTLALATLSLLLIWLERGGLTRQGALALAVLFGLWSNIHQGILAGYLVLGGWLVFGRRPIRQRLVLSGLAVLASMLRPNILSQPAFYRDTFSNTQAMRGVVEWGVPSWEQRLTHLGPFYLVLILVAGFTLHRLVRRSSLPPWAFGVTSLAFTIAGWNSFRSMAELLPIVCPLVAPYFPSLPRGGWTQRLVALFLAGLLLSTFHGRNLRGLDRVEGVPRELARLIPKEGQVLNSFEFGNFLVFEGIAPFIHGMSALYQEQLVLDFEAILNPTPRRLELLARYNVTSALLHFPTENDATLLLVEFLAAAPDWKLQAWDDTGLLFVKGAPNSGLTAVRPWAAQGWLDPVAAEAELRTLLGHHPSALGHLFLSRLLLEKGELGEATKNAIRSTELSPNWTPAWMQLGGCYAKSGNLTGMLLATEEAVELSPSNPQAQLNRSLAFLAMGKTRGGVLGDLERLRARYHAKRALWGDPNLEAARKVLREL